MKINCNQYIFRDSFGPAQNPISGDWLGLGPNFVGPAAEVTPAIARMVTAVRREALAWILAGLALHWIAREGFSRWSLTALAMALGVGITATTTSGSPVVTVNTMIGLEADQRITIVGVTGTHGILSIDRTNIKITLDGNADASVVGAAVAYSAPTFAALPF